MAIDYEPELKELHVAARASEPLGLRYQAAATSRSGLAAEWCRRKRAIS
jgi:hypothetical protein